MRGASRPPEFVPLGIDVGIEGADPSGNPVGLLGTAVCPGLLHGPYMVEDDRDHSRFELPGSTSYLDRAAQLLISTNSISVPARSAGCTKAIRDPLPPMRGSSSTSRAPVSLR